MGLLMEYLKKRKGEKKTWIYALEWITDIVLAMAFIYLSWQVRIMVLNCTCNPVEICGLDINQPLIFNISDINGTD